MRVSLMWLVSDVAIFTVAIIEEKNRVDQKTKRLVKQYLGRYNRLRKEFLNSII